MHTCKLEVMNANNESKPVSCVIRKEKRNRSVVFREGIILYDNMITYTNLVNMVKNIYITKKIILKTNLEYCII